MYLEGPATSIVIKQQATISPLKRRGLAQAEIPGNKDHWGASSQASHPTWTMPSTTHWVISVVLHFALWLSYFKCTPLQISESGTLLLKGIKVLVPIWRSVQLMSCLRKRGPTWFGILVSSSNIVLTCSFPELQPITVLLYTVKWILPWSCYSRNHKLHKGDPSIHDYSSTYTAHITHPASIFTWAHIPGSRSPFRCFLLPFSSAEDSGSQLRTILIVKRQVRSKAIPCPEWITLDSI